ncbi:PAAR domain-containing protein [Oceanimonas sp. CHS3-5]|uniref:PAAR domain-containing protein n=1 Tax=Oceanimonas sp. CHS3-5 TaxID=3068186 RepID=UPI00273F6C61|nr:PAAR domain-containing protein [Oceanimonas sp. CHS3-5]MDP5291697.1 PAAR domain-containing protein [Oceanimonas sp. CHS3-5]
MAKIARLGDATSQGGSVLEGDQTVMHGGKPVARVGMLASCPKCQKGQGPIVPVAPRTVQLPGGLVALAGDQVACGCPPGSHVLVPVQGDTNAAG